MDAIGWTYRLILQTPLDRKGLSGPALRTFFRIAELWSLSVHEQMTLLGLSARSTFFKWKKHSDITLPIDTLERIFLHHRDLQGTSDPATRMKKQQTNGVRRPNTASLFSGAISA